MEIEQFSISLELLRVMFSFVELLGKPTSTTISENDLYHLEWKLKNNSSILLRPKNDELIDYVIFKPTSQSKKRTILNGSMSPNELLSFIKENV